ncbi:hypothetical protein IWZ00DRAFT_274151 [Phyllosticta capitalensis]
MAGFDVPWRSYRICSVVLPWVFLELVSRVCWMHPGLHAFICTTAVPPCCSFAQNRFPIYMALLQGLPKERREKQILCATSPVETSGPRFCTLYWHPVAAGSCSLAPPSHGSRDCEPLQLATVIEGTAAEPRTGLQTYIVLPAARVSKFSPRAALAYDSINPPSCVSPGITTTYWTTPVPLDFGFPVRPPPWLTSASDQICEGLILTTADQSFLQRI